MFDRFRPRERKNINWRSLMYTHYKIISNKILIHTTGRLCESTEEILKSDLFLELLKRCILELAEKESPLLGIFSVPGDKIGERQITLLVDTLENLLKIEGKLVPNILPESGQFFRDIQLFSDFVEYFYNYWRGYERYVICNSAERDLDKRPYRTFNQTVGNLTHFVRSAYRDIEENITGSHPRIYRQITAGAEFGTISLPVKTPYGGGAYNKLKPVSVIRQVLLNPPLILEPPMNKRTGSFVKIDTNPLDVVDIETGEWLCYPAKVGELLVNVYFHEKYYELGFSLCNLFELADDEDLKRKPDAVYLYGVPGDSLDGLAQYPTVFHDDEENKIFVAACPGRDEFGYFGYLKKMILTLHNAIMIKSGRLPFHGSLVKITMKNNVEATVLMIGDTGAGKSETLEAYRAIGGDVISNITIIADDMGSLRLDENGDIIGYGTEIGAFLRLDDLQPGYAFGQIDRSIIMNASQVNARVIIPVCSYENIMKGCRVDYILYANNYDEIDEDHPVVERFNDHVNAFNRFREGTVMSKGTTTSTGLVHSYFANIFGAPQYKELHDPLAMKFFEAFFASDIFVGQIRTRLGIKGWEMTGPEEAAKELLRVISEGSK